MAHVKVVYMYFPLSSSLASSPMLNIGSQVPDTDVLELLWHRLLADASYRVIRESVKNKLIEGIALDRKYLI